MKLTQMIEKFAKQGMLNGVARAELLQAAEETEQEMAELQAINASFWYSYDELTSKNPDELIDINNWKHNPMAALPAWITIISQK